MSHGWQPMSEAEHREYQKIAREMREEARGAEEKKEQSPPEEKKNSG